jgi:hypothetical protein
VLLVHPIHNFGIVRFDPEELEALCGAGGPTIAEVAFAEPGDRLRVGDPTTFFGLTIPFVPVYQRAVVTKAEVLKLNDGRSVLVQGSKHPGG